MRANGPIPEGHAICHVCDVRLCCNPAHLFAAPQSENIADMVAKGRQAKGDRSGARLHPERIRHLSGDDHWARRHPELVLRGERNGRTKLSTAQLAEVIRRYRSGGVSQSALAREFGVSPSRIQQIVSAAA
jgi:hypothetical protein